MSVTEKLQQKMQTKLLSFMLATLLILTVVVSAATFSVSPTTISLNPSKTNSTFTVTNLNSSAPLDVNVPSTVQVEGEDGYVALFNIAGTKTGINTTSVFTITPSSSIDFSKISLTDVYSNLFNITDANNATEKQEVKLELQNDFCKEGNKGKLEITSLKFDVTKGYGDKSDEFYLLDEVEVEVRVDNNGNDKIRDVTVSWGLYDKANGKFIIDDEEKNFDLKDGSDETITITFTVDPNDFEQGFDEDDFVFFVKAYSDDEGEDVQCNSDSQDVKIIQDRDFVVLNDFGSFPETLQCGENVELRAETWNIGSDDQQDVYFMITNSELGINQKINVGDLDSLDDKKTSFTLQMPNEAKEGSYKLRFAVYDENDDIFENDNNDESSLDKIITLSGNCKVEKDAIITAVLDSSEAMAGQEFTVRATISNTGSDTTSYQVSVTGYENWATLSSINPTTLSLEEGKSGDVFVKLIANEDISGNQEFTVRALFEGGVKEQRISVPITESTKNSGITGGAIFDSIKSAFQGNALIWIIGIINVILIILIIVIALRIIRK